MAEKKTVIQVVPKEAPKPSTGEPKLVKVEVVPKERPRSKWDIARERRERTLESMSEEERIASHLKERARQRQREIDHYRSHIKSLKEDLAKSEKALAELED